MSPPDLANPGTALRAFLARILGWANTGAIEAALRAIHLVTTHHTALVLLGDHDVVPLARALHRRIFSEGRPFVVCDRRRPDVSATHRVHGSGVAAVQAAEGGSLCLREARMPRDLRSMAALIRGPGAPVQIIICGGAHDALHPYLLHPAPILIPPLHTRASELSRIVDEYADDAIGVLSAEATGFTPADRKWVMEHAASTLSEIEKGTRRLVALRQAGSINRAAARLGMSRAALSAWIQRRGSVPEGAR